MIRKNILIRYTLTYAHIEHVKDINHTHLYYLLISPVCAFN